VVVVRASTVLYRSSSDSTSKRHAPAHVSERYSDTLQGSNVLDFVKCPYPACIHSVISLQSIEGSHGSHGPQVINLKSAISAKPLHRLTNRANR